MPDYGRHFNQVAGNYDALRREATDAIADWLIETGTMEPRQRLLDVGCGTGAMTALLVERADVDALGVDPSEEMLEQARQRAGPRCHFIAGSAEELPVADESVDRVLMQTVVHLVDRPVAIAEACRVLRDDGVLIVCTVDPAGVDDFWLTEWFPSWADIDRARFPTLRDLGGELESAGFRVGLSRYPRRLDFTRDHALSMLRARFASSFALIDEDEFQQGLADAEARMPDTFSSTLQLACLAGRR